MARKDGNHQWRKGTATYERWLRGGRGKKTWHARKVSKKAKKRTYKCTGTIKDPQKKSDDSDLGYRGSNYGKSIIGWCRTCRWWSGLDRCVRCGSRAQVPYFRQKVIEAASKERT